LFDNPAVDGGFCHAFGAKRRADENAGGFFGSPGVAALNEYGDDRQAEPAGQVGGAGQKTSFGLSGFRQRIMAAVGIVPQPAGKDQERQPAPHRLGGGLKECTVEAVGIVFHRDKLHAFQQALAERLTDPFLQKSRPGTRRPPAPVAFCDHI
jgi:hypothetical protein